MDGGTLGFSYDDSQFVPLIVQALAWSVVVVAAAVAVRRPWAWFGLTGGLLGLAVTGTYLVDEIQIRSAVGEPSAHVFDPEHPDFPGFLLDHDLSGLLDWSQTVAMVLVAVAFVVVAAGSRRRDRSAGA